MSKTFTLRSQGIVFEVISLLTQHWAAAVKSGRCLVIEIYRESDARTLAQNRRYFGSAVLGAIEQQAWVNGRQYDKETWHEIFKRKFIGVIELHDGSVVGMSSTKLTTKEFSDFMNNVEAYAASELGVVFDD